LRGADNHIIGAVMVLRDVTERERLEREAAERATELATVVQAMPDSVALFDTNGQAVLVNAAFHDLFALDQRPGFFGQSMEERRRLLEISDVDGGPLPSERSPLERVLRHGETLTGAAAMVIRTEAPDGRVLDLEVVGRPVYDAIGDAGPGQGRVRGAILLYRDVTERRRLERRTREALDALLRMAEALVVAPEGSRQPTPGATLDVASVFSETRDAPLPVSAASLTNSVARRVAELAREVLGATRLSMHALDPETQTPVPLAVTGLTPEQERDWFTGWDERPLRDTPVLNAVLDERPGIVRVLDLAQPPYDELRVRFGIQTLALAPMQVGDQLVGVLALDYGGAPHVYTDDELDLTAAVARLAGLIIERDRLLHEREQARSRALALAEANRRMDEFLSIASHEIKTPLTAIKANVQLARRQAIRALTIAREQGYAQARELELVANLAARAAAAADRQERLVADLLDVSRLTSSHLELRPERVDLAEILRDTIEEQRLTQPGRRLHVSGLVGPMMVEADAERIRQVITNYLGNALKYSPEGCPVEIQLAVEAQRARVTVRDEGTGIPREELERIWDRFQRAADAQHVSGSSVGLGLGLYIAREIVERHHGAVGVESVVGRGSTFWFTLPLVADPPKSSGDG
ncbi:MAG TPA: ATP-binding protein, partial [Ktedonobacterales bacterium]|nr:ATP-binding protein [Ktedonobacterales bacterium]